MLLRVIQGLRRVSGIEIVNFAVQKSILVILVDIDLSEVHIHGAVDVERMK